MSVISSEMNCQEQIKDHLKGLDHKQVAFFSWLCAVRALPFLGAKGHFNYWKGEFKEDNKIISKQQLHLNSIFDALDMAASRITYDINKDADTALLVSANSAFYIAAHASNAAYDAASDVAASAAAEAVADAAFAVSTAYSVDAAEAAGGSYNSITDVNVSIKVYNNAITASKEYNVDLHDIFLSDIECIKTKTYDGLNNETGVYGELWGCFQNALKNVGCDYWGKLYERVYSDRFLQNEKALIQRSLEIPNEKKKQGAASVAKYLEKLESEVGKSLNEARILILGDKGAGKTSLARRLVNPDAPMPRVEDSTKGVQTTLWKIFDNESSYINTHIWDFAGHVITHAAHRCFLSERCSYIILHEGRYERDRLGFWLDHIRSYGGDAPTWIVVNKFDGHLPVILENKLKDRYPFIQGFVYFSINTEISDLNNFRHVIETFILNNPLWNKQKIPSSYYKVKSVLENSFQEGIEQITRANFSEIASEFGIEEEEQDELLSLLSELGICHWYVDVNDFDELVLNPNWIVYGIYTTINWAYNNKKHIIDVEEDYKKIFVDEVSRYSEDQFKFIFELMKKFELAYSKDDRMFAIPHLSEDQPPKLPDFAINESLMLKYVSEQVLPPHTVCRLIVKHCDEIRSDNEVWRYGVVSKYGNNTIATVVEDDRNISITVKGGKRNEYITKLRASMNEIFESYKSDKPELQYRVVENYPKEVYQSADEGVLLPYKEIKSHIKKERSYLTTSGVDIPVELLLGMVYNYNITEFNVEELNMRDKYEIRENDGQIVFKPKASKIIQNNGIDVNQLNELIEGLLKTFPINASADEAEAFNDSIEVIQDPKSKKSLIRTALSTLKTIKGTVEFSAAIAALVQFFASMGG